MIISLLQTTIKRFIVDTLIEHEHQHEIYIDILFEYIFGYNIENVSIEQYGRMEQWTALRFTDSSCLRISV